MFICKIKWFVFFCLLTLTSFAGIALGNLPPLVFVPSTSDYNGTHGEFFGTSMWTHTVGAAWGSTNAHADNGFVWVDVQAMLGGSSGSSWQGVEFDVNLPSTVTADVTITYVGNAVNFDAAAFSSIAWEWQVEKLKDPNTYTWIVVGRERNDIISAFSLTILAEKTAETLLAGIAAYYGDAFDISGIEEYGTGKKFEQSCNELSQTLYDAYFDYGANYERLQKTFNFTVDPGKYHLFVGARGDASGFVLGAGFALIYAQIEKITLTIDDGYRGQPDLIIQSLNVPDPVFGPSLLLTEFQKNETVTFDVVVANIGTAAAYNTTYTFDVCEPNAADYNLVDCSTSPVIILPHSSYHFNPHYTFPKKGLYSFKAIADEPNFVAESDENNNELIKQYYVKGLAPYKPQKPSVLGAYCSGHLLYRNNDVTICTSATDPENDPLKYQFFFHRTDANGNDIYYSIPWDPNSIKGWSDCNCMPFSPSGVADRSAEGTYYVWARAIDTDGLMSEPSDQQYFVVAANQAPEFNEINAPDQAYLGSTVSFTVSCTDQEKDLIHYQFGWGDGTLPTDYWSVISGESVTVEHTFDANLGEGKHPVYIYATDTFGASSWNCLWINLKKYVAPVGTITVETNNPISTFDISGPNQFYGSGSFWATGANQAKVGNYTITFSDVSFYNTPQSSTKYLGVGQSITFEGQYTHKTGTIDVNTNSDSASFNITGHFDAKGQNMSVIGRVFGPWTTYAGVYRIIYGSVPGYCSPATNGEEKTLQGNQTLVFNGRYTLPPVALLDVNMPARGFAIAGEDMVKFDASASHSQEPDLSITKYVFDFGDGVMYTESSDVNAPDGNFDGKTMHVYADSDCYTPKLFVYDTFGNEVGVDANMLKVKSRPRAFITSITPSPAIAGETVGFTGKGTDVDHDAIIAYEWQSNIDGNLSSAKDFNTNLLSPGIHAISFRVQDINELWSQWTQTPLVVYDAISWPLFKNDLTRCSNQGSYPRRLYGMLNYGLSWSYPANGQITGSPVAANLDGNSVNGLEIAFATNVGAGELYVINKDGNLIWSKNIGSSKSTPAIGDINNDGNLDIVIGSASGVYAYNKDGNSIYTFNAPMGQGFDSTPVIADIDANPCNGKETIIGCNDGHVYAIDKNGNQRWAFASPTLKAFTSSAAVADIEPNRPGLETVIAGTDGILYVLDSNGLAIATYMTPSGRPIFTTPAITKLNPNLQGSEIVFGSDDGYLYCLNYNNFSLSFCWRYATSPLRLIRSSPAVGTCYSGQTQVVFGCDNGNVYVLLDNGGAPVCTGTFRCGVAGDGTMVRSTPVIVNIDTIHNLHPIYGDLPEVIVAATDGKLYALSFAVGGAGVNLPWSPVNISPGIPIYSSPAVADINHTPDLEILIGSNNNNLYLVSPLRNSALAPVAHFTAAPLSGNPPLQVSFNDQSTNSPFSWSWDFGDGNTSTDQNSNHIYNVPGTYNVSLTVTNPQGPNSITKNNYITVNPVPVAAFTNTPVSGTVPFQVNFSDQSQYGPTSWSWDFGDGGTSTSQNPSHNYTEPNNLYTVSLTVSNAYGSNNVTKTDCILTRAPQPVADFTQDVTNGQPPLSVSFTDLSTGSPTNWLWNFGDGNTSGQQNPSHNYTSSGNYLVSLTVSNSTGSDTKINSFYIRVGHKLCDFNHDGIVDIEDLMLLVNDWLQTNSVFVGDIAPSPNGDGTVNFTDFALFAQNWASR
jgi:PKD repeat protein